jgi:hypothetical protein
MASVYVAASFEQSQQVRDVYKSLAAAGHIVTLDWTSHKEVRKLKSTSEKVRLAKSYAIDDVNGVIAADVFVLLTGPRKSTGAHIELGIALGDESKQIYLVGKIIEDHIFYHHPKIKWAENIEALIKALGDEQLE